MDKFSELKRLAEKSPVQRFEPFIGRAGGRGTQAIFNADTKGEVITWSGFDSSDVTSRTGREAIARFVAAVDPETVLAMLAELEAKDKRIAELEAIRADSSLVLKEIGNELGCNPDNESIMMAIDDLKATQMTGPLKDVLKRNIELEAKLATPVRLPKRWDVSGQVNPPRIVEVQFEQQNRTHDQCAKAIRDAGFTVVVEGGK
ncbi:ead/Ea22-like family protein [Serratia sp. CY81489]|uniref:ead/Ea22-like family protein n=1 Tax=unclassified Serratia (in: enterobacteria) TaxID=2647522 RepID=UPI003F9FC81E